jgi:integrase
MAKPLALTQANVKALHYTRTDGQPQFTWDTDQIGLGVRITASGVKSFVLRYRVLDRQRLKTLGKTANHSVDAARIWARAGLSAADRNEDFQAAEEQQRALGTMAQLWRRYIDEHAKVHGAERTPRDLEGLWKTHLEKTFGARRVTEVTTADVRAWHRRASQRRVVAAKGKRGATWQRAVGGAYVANRALQALKAAINWQMAEGTLPGDFRNPCLGVGMNEEKSRDVILRPAELPKLAKAIDKHPDKYAGAFVWLALRTGARRGELLKLEWSHLDLKGGTVKLVDTKNRTDRTLPLDADAVSLLKKLPRLEGNPYVFVGRWDRGHRDSFKDAWAEMRKGAGLPHLHLHDLRRTVGSWLGAAGHTAQMIGELLGHRSDVTSRVYVKLGALDVKKQLVDAHAAAIDSALKRKRTARARTPAL